MKKRAISLTLVLMMLLTLIPTAAFAENREIITEVRVDGYMDPILRYENDGYIYPGISADAPYNLVKTVWYSDSENSTVFTPMARGVKFVEGRTYKFYMEFEPKDGYAFDLKYMENAVINDGTVERGWGSGVRDNGNYYFWGPETKAKEAIDYCLYRDAADEYSTMGCELPMGYVLRSPAAPGEEGRTFVGWYYDRECTQEFVPNCAVYEDVTLYGKWIAKDDRQTIESVSAEMDFFPPAVGDEAADSNYVYVDSTAPYELVMAYWYCDYKNGEDYNCDYADGEVFESVDECSFCIFLVPKEGYKFDGEITEFRITDIRGNEVPLSDEWCTVYEDSAWIWTQSIAPIEYVSFYNAWGEAGYLVPKGYIPGSAGDPGREGFVFGGWYTDEALTVPFDPAKPLLEDTTIYPKWLIPNPFKDISEAAVYYDAVLWAAEHNITGGYPDGTFRPNATCTRAQVVTFLWRAAGCPEPTGDTSMFKDSASIAPDYKKAVAWAVEKEITTGFNDGTFRPNASVTRAQFVTFLWRYEGRQPADGTLRVFSDAGSIASGYQKAVLWAIEKGITTGYGDGTFRPDATCTRWQVVLFMFRDIT
ncbi:MAG: S-layer homology domain-containing protein [Bacillota bacterium]|nr:S-layer homology domain-containing protein [Bacillota bacterium]